MNFWLRLGGALCPRAQQAGGNALEASLLETPTFVLSVVFFVFLALSFSFELVRKPVPIIT